MKLKQVLFRLFDLISIPLTMIAAHQMWLLRRYGIPNFPLAHRYLLKAGVFPIRRHFYEPQFHPDDLSSAFAEERELPAIEFKIEEQIERFSKFNWQGELSKFQNKTIPVLDNGTTFDIDNTAFGPGDIDFYYQIIRHLKPKRIIEIGSGHSTIVALSAIEENRKENPNQHCAITAIEPYPWFRHPSLDLIEKKVEETALSLFEKLEEGDILFIDSSHVVRPEGDVIHEYLHILPLLKKGVYIHIHDIFTPFNYPENWTKSWHLLWNEQYVFEALLSGGDNYEVYASLHLLSQKHSEATKGIMPLLKPNSRHPQSFWIRKISNP